MNVQNPKIEQALIEIREVLQKYDLGAFVQVATDTESEFVTVFPKWSIAQLEPTPDGKQSLVLHVTPDDPRKDALGKQAMAFLLTMRNVCARQCLILDSVTKDIAERLDLDVEALFEKPKQSRPQVVQ